LVTSRSFRQTTGQHWEILGAAGVEVVDSGVPRALTEDEMVEKMGDVDGALLGVDPVTARVIDAARNLKAISRQGVGVDSVDLAACTRRGIVVTNTPGTSTGSVAELAIGLTLALLRHIPQLDRSVKDGGWSRRLGQELTGRTVGLIGFGRIAQDIARKLQGFGVRVLFYDPYPPPAEVAQGLAARPVSLEELLSQADIVSLHAALSEANQRMINHERLALMKPTALLVNTARGGLVDEHALAEALRTGQLAGAASDVFDPEPPVNSPLLGLDNFVATAHCGAYTTEANARVAVASARNLVDALMGKRPASTVNPEVYRTAAEP
jgi:D-3-phosphoglycerate dehydrogenase